MAVEKSVLTAIESALASDPANVDLRLHLASLFYEDGQFSQTLDHCQKILAQDPVHLRALEKAADAAEKLSDLDRSQAYRKLLKALKENEREVPPYLPARYDNDGWDDVLTDEPQPERVGARDSYNSNGVVNDHFFEVETPDLRLSDVAGMEAVKRRLNLAFLAPLKNPEMMQLYGKSLRGGLMLYGPPGCGKTYIARAVAGELGARFISIGISDVLDMWIGNSEKNLAEIFKRARRQSPCVLFFDEIDALGRKRSLVRHSPTGVINQLLSELDGINQNNDGVFVLAATNHPWDVDSALRRPGRFDRTVLVLPPDQPARQAILEMNLRGRPADASIDTEKIAAKINEFSGADVAHLVESAAEFAIEDSLTTGKARSISMNDFKRALKEVKPSTRPWFDIAKNYALFSNDGGMYDDLLNYLKQLRII